MTLPPYHYVKLYWSENVKKKNREEPQLVLWTQESATVRCTILKPDSLQGSYRSPNQASQAVRKLWDENPSVNWKMQWGVVSVHEHRGSTRNYSVKALGSNLSRYFRPLPDLHRPSAQHGLGTGLVVGALADKETGLVPFDEAGALADEETRLVPFDEAGALADEETGLGDFFDDTFESNKDEVQATIQATFAAVVEEEEEEEGKAAEEEAETEESEHDEDFDWDIKCETVQEIWGVKKTGDDRRLDAIQSSDLKEVAVALRVNPFGTKSDIINRLQSSKAGHYFLNSLMEKAAQTQKEAKTQLAKVGERVIRRYGAKLEGGYSCPCSYTSPGRWNMKRHMFTCKRIKTLRAQHRSAIKKKRETKVSRIPKKKREIKVSRIPKKKKEAKDLLPSRIPKKKRGTKELPSVPQDFMHIPLSELINVARELGVKTYGSKCDVINRLYKHAAGAYLLTQLSFKNSEVTRDSSTETKREKRKREVGNQTFTFSDKVARIKNELSIDGNASALAAIHQANLQMGIEPVGNARAQVEHLMTHLQ